MFRSVSFESQSECIIARATSAVDIKALVLTSEFLGIRSVVACAGTADTAEGFTRWYSRILRTVVHIDVRTSEFALYRSVTQSIYRLSKAHLADASRKGLDCVARATRPASTAFHDRLKRSSDVRHGYSGKQNKTSPMLGGSPRIRVSLSQATSSSRTSQPSASTLATHDRDTLQSQSAGELDITSGEALDPPSDEGSESVARCSTSVTGKPAFGQKPRQSIWLLVGEFSGVSTLLQGFHRAKLNRERITALTLEALMQRCKSPASARNIANHVGALVKFFLDTRDESNPSGCSLTGEGSVVLLRDFLESAADRGGTVPGAVKSPISAWSEALGFPWPLDNSLVCAAAQAESNDTPKHAPPMRLETIKKLEELATNVEISPFKRAFATGILLMTYATLRFSDVQRLRSLAVNDDTTHGTLLQSKTKKPHGLPWPCACPRVGVTGPTEWLTPLMDFHTAHARQNGSRPSFVFPRLNRKWELERADEAAYSSTRRKLALLCAGIGGPDADSHTLHSPKNFLPTAATQINFATRELNVVGHWSSNSRMNERYDRSVCARELHLRNTSIRKMVGGWNMVDSFHLPESVTNATRIGKGPVTEQSSKAENVHPQVESGLVPSTAEPLAPVVD